MLNYTLEALVIELHETKRLLAEKEAELNAIKEKRMRRAENAKRNRRKSPEEKEFGTILRSSNTKLVSQEYQDAVTFNRIIKKRIAQKQYSEYSFFSLFNRRIDRLKGFTPFVFDCEACNLNPDAVAQYVVSRGEKTINLVFKDGLIATIGKDTLYLMNERIFSDDELKLSQYVPAKHPEPADTQVVA